MYQLSILVLLYNCSVEESKTLSSLFNMKFYGKNVKLVIWNNGPITLKAIDCLNDKNREIEIDFLETLCNESLSKIYNDFLDRNVSNKYLILDHDSLLDQLYINAVISSNKNEILIPQIVCNNIVRAPFINGKIYNEKMIFDNSDLIISIGSGLVIGNAVVKEMMYKYGKVFDERFFLYGVDTSFFKRLNKILKVSSFEISILPPIIHSLSRLETEEKDISRFRLIERSYDMGLSLRYYTNKFKIPVYILKFFFTNLISYITNKKRNYSFTFVMKAFFQGKHYRNKL